MRTAACLGIVLACLLAGTLCAEPAPTPTPKDSAPDLQARRGEMARGEGFVNNTNGEPIAGAIIRVSAVRDLNTDDKSSVQNGPGVGLGAETDEKGHFILPPMPDDRLYRLVVWAQGYESLRYRGMDVKSNAVEIRLKTLKGASPNPKYAVNGRVVGPDGKPIPFAPVEHDGFTANGTTGWGMAGEGLPGDILADSKGEFYYGRDKQIERLQLRITVPGLAPFHDWLNVTNAIQEVKLTIGAAIRGRILKGSQPLTNLAVGVTGSERNSDIFAGNFDAKTGTNGEFVFEHLPPNTSWYIYGKISSFKKYGALRPSPARTGDDGGSTDLGDMQVMPSAHLAGTVKTRSGEPLPKGLKVMVGFENAWDSQTADVDKDGYFRLDGLPAGVVVVNLRERNWHLSGLNRSLDTLNPWRLMGQLEGDKDDLVLLIEKGRQQMNNSDTSNGRLPTADEPQARPLSGAEESGGPSITLAGRVVDDATGQPVQNFTIVPGYKPPKSTFLRGPVRKPLLQKVLSPFESKPPIPWDERIYWRHLGAQTFSNGVFSVPFMVLTSQPVVRVEAPGYEPLESDPTNQTTTNLVLRLTKGSGPNGVVLLPNGSPATGATVAYGVNQEQFSMTGTSIGNYGQKKALQVTKADGKFSFEPRDEESMLFVAHSAGWAEQPLDRHKNNLRIELRPWASMTGTLVDSNNVPMPGVSLALTMFHPWNSGGSFVNLQNQAVTDAKGHFIFTNVAPTRIEIQRLIPMSSHSWRYQEQTWLFVQPGITNELGNVIYDTPPPPPAMERLKQTLGL